MRAFKWLLARVDAPVGTQATGMAECLATADVRTLERFLARVGAYVGAQVAVDAEGLSAADLWTLEWLLACMDAGMSAQIGRVFEGLVAHLADVATPVLCRSGRGRWVNKVVGLLTRIRIVGDPYRYRSNGSWRWGIRGERSLVV